MKRITLFLCLSGLVLAGCRQSPPQSTSVAEAPKPPPSTTGVAVPPTAPGANAGTPKVIPVPTPGTATPPSKTPPKPNEPSKVAVSAADKQRILDEVKQQRQAAQRIIAIEKPEAGEWHKSTMSATQLATKVGSAVSSLHGAYADMMTLVDGPMGHGTFNEQLKVVDDKQYKVDFLTPGSLPAGSSIVANGKQKMVRIGSKWIRPVPVKKPIALVASSPSAMFERWPKEFPRLIFQGLTDGVDAWRPVLARFEKDPNYKVWSEERTIDVSGRKYHHYRIRIERQDAVAKKLGTSSMEIVVDGNRFVPLTVRLVDKDPKGVLSEMMWTGGYRFNQKFTDKDFKAPYNMKGG